MKIHLHKVDAAPRDSHPGRQHLFVGIVTFKGGKQGGVDVQQVPSPLLHKLPCSDKKPQFIHTTCMLNQTNTNIQPEKNPVHKKAFIIKKLTTTKSFHYAIDYGLLAGEHTWQNPHEAGQTDDLHPCLPQTRVHLPVKLLPTPEPLVIYDLSTKNQVRIGEYRKNVKSSQQWVFILPKEREGRAKEWYH